MISPFFAAITCRVAQPERREPVISEEDQRGKKCETKLTISPNNVNNINNDAVAQSRSTPSEIKAP